MAATGEGEGVGLGDGVADGEGVGVSVALGEGVGVGEGVADGDGVGVAATTVKSTVLVTVPPGAVTVIGPLVAPAGTVAAITGSLQTMKDDSVP